MIERICQWCREQFQAHSWEVKRGRGKFCSVSCKSQYGRSLQDQSGPNNPPKYAAQWNARNPEKRRAHHAVQNAIKTGALTRKPCSFCGDDRDVHAHHSDYEKPLDVKWLCRGGHTAQHMKAA